jgi:Holliday junction resolvase RusA-like endonuclease
MTKETVTTARTVTSISTGQPDGPTALVIEVVGTPAPQGSKSFKGFRGGKPVLVESCTGVAPWRAAVVRATTEAMKSTGMTTVVAPSMVVIDFYLPRPASAPKHRTVPDRRPDLDKLIRSTLDALTTAGAIEDDARVVEILARKHYAADRYGARIVLRAL